MANLQELVGAHEPDVAWIVGLWLAIHGGDPSSGERADVRVDQTTALLATALSARLAEVNQLPPITSDALEERLGRLGVTMRRAGNDPEGPSLDEEHSPQGKRAIWKCVYIGGDTGWCCNVVGYEN